jgi:sialic acid synthase SpsE
MCQPLPTYSPSKDDAVFTIAEVGSNHCGSLERAKESIHAASEAGASAVKFQSIDLSSLYYKPSPSTVELHEKIDLPEEWHAELQEYADNKKITFFSTPTYLGAVDILEDLAVPFYKLASAQIGVFPQLVDKVVSLGKPVLFSTGLITTSEIHKIIATFKKHKNNNYIILYCNSIYPTPYEKINLGLIPHYKKTFKCPVGFSDHSEGIATTLAAVAKGAQVIEKHFTLDRTSLSPDSAFSLTPPEFKELIEGVRIVERVNTFDPRINIEEAEQKFKNDITHKLVLNRDVSIKDKIKATDIKFLRSPHGINCDKLNFFLEKGATYSRTLKKNTLLKSGDLNLK